MRVAPRKFSAPAGRALPTTGTVSLVALCFIAVLGIVLASYITVCSRAMNLSNRSFQSSLSQQLAEFGLEEGLRAFNKNDWSNWSSIPSGLTASAWTLDPTNKRASRTLTVNATKLGQGMTATVKIRIDNYDAANLDSNWSNTTTYRINDLVGYNGTWYRCVRDNSFANTPGTVDYQWWVPVPIAWAWNSNHSYTANYDVVCYQGVWRLCTTTHTSGSAFVGSNWTSLAAPSVAWTSSTPYGVGALVYRTSNNTWYRCTTAHTSSGSFDGTKFVIASWSYDPSVNYSFDDVVLSSGTWYRYINATTTSGNTPSPGSYWEYARSGSMFGWSNAGLNYNLGDVVYYSTTGQWYRCIRAHTSSSTYPPNSVTYPYWSNDPLYSLAWNPDRQYSVNDTVTYNGAWYFCLQAHTSSTTVTPSNTTRWASATNSSYYWNPAGTYNTSSYVSYGGVWYKCATVPTAGQSPNNSTYWTPTWANSAGITTGAPVIYAEASITLPNNPPARTQLRAVISPAPLFPNAAAATTTLTVFGGGTVNSYDSLIDPSAAAPGYSAVVAAGNTSGTVMTLSGAVTIDGYVAVAATSGSPLLTYGGSTVVKGSATIPSPKIDPSRVSRSPYIPQFAPLPVSGATSPVSELAASFSSNNFPRGTALVMPSGTGNTVNLGTPGAVTPSRYYFNGDLTISDSSPIAVLNINGPVILYINGDLTLDGVPAPNGVININSAGSAEIHIADSLLVLQDSDGIQNRTLDPTKLVVICDTTSSSDQKYADGAYPFYGVIYAPNTTATVGLNFSNTTSPSAATYAVYGAVSARRIKYDNDANIHYDTSLRYISTPGVDQPYAVTQWRDLPVTEQATLP